MRRTAVRPAVAEDLAAIVGLERSIPELPHWSEAEYRRYLQADTKVNRRLLVVEDQEHGLVAGFAAAVIPIRAGMAEVESLAVLPTRRRGGLGRLLVMAMGDWCQMCGAAGMELEVRAQSEGAIALYRSVGFAAVGRRRGYYANPVDDALLMSLLF